MNLSRCMDPSYQELTSAAHFVMWSKEYIHSVSASLILQALAFSDWLAICQSVCHTMRVEGQCHMLSPYLTASSSGPSYFRPPYVVLLNHNEDQ